MRTRRPAVLRRGLFRVVAPVRAARLMRAIREYGSAGVVGALIVSAALSLSLTACGHHPKTAVRGEHGMFVMDDFESGALTGWRAVGAGSGGWFVYTHGSKAPDPSQSDPNVPFDVPDPPQGRFAAVTDANGPGTRILYRDVKLDGRFRLHLSVFYAGVGGFSSPQTLAYDEPGANQQFRIDLDRSVGADRLRGARGCPGEHLQDVARRSGPSRAEHRQRRRVALGGPDGAPSPRRYRQRRSTARRRGRHPLRADRRERERPDRASAHRGAGTRREPRAAPNDGSGRVEDALGPRREARGRGSSSPARCWSPRTGRVLFRHAYGLADRNRRIPNTIRTRFRIGSMNKMFTAVAILQLVEAGKVKLTAPLGTYLPDYPNHERRHQGHDPPAADTHRRHGRHLRPRLRRPPHRAAHARRLREALRQAGTSSSSRAANGRTATTASSCSAP